MIDFDFWLFFFYFYFVEIFFSSDFPSVIRREMKFIPILVAIESGRVERGVTPTACTAAIS